MRTSFVANGSCTSFPFSFPTDSLEDIEVLVDGIAVVSGLTILGAGSTDGGAVTLASPPAQGSTVVIRHRGQVTVSDVDARAGHLSDKLVAGTNAALTTMTAPDGSQTMVIAGPDTADFARRSQNLADLADMAAARSNLGVYSGVQTDAAIAAAAPDLSPFARNDQNLAGLTDKLAARSNLGLGSAAALDVGSQPGQVVQLDANGRLPSVDGSQLTNIPFGRVKASATDNVADFLDAKIVAGANVAITEVVGSADRALSIAAATDPAVSELLATLLLNQGILALIGQKDRVSSVKHLIDGFSDAFADQSGVGNSAGAIYDPSSMSYYNPGTVTGLSSSAAWTGSTSAFTFSGADLSPNSDGGNAIRLLTEFNGDFEISYEATGGGSQTDAMFIGVQPTTDTFIQNDTSAGLKYSTSWAIFGQGVGYPFSPYYNGIVGSSLGTLGDGDILTLRRVGVTLTLLRNGTTIHTFGTTSSAQVRLVLGGRVGPTFRNLNWSIPGQVQDMTLVSNSLPARAQTVESRVLLLHEAVDALTLNTDCTIEASRDGGTTWTVGTLADLGAFDSSKRILAATVDLSAQPSGTAMKWRFKTYNAKSQRLHGVWMQWR